MSRMTMTVHAAVIWHGQVRIPALYLINYKRSHRDDHCVQQIGAMVDALTAPCPL
jgi:hypothetical protein